MSLLKRYWFSFERIPRPTNLNLGCGITAYTKDDALNLLRENLFPDGAVPTITKVTEDVDVSTLDKNHVLPNIGVTSVRGIWFPNLPVTERR